MPRRQSNQRWKNQVQEAKRKDAEKRAEAYSKRTVEEQLALIDSRPGNSTKERTKLMEEGK